MISDEGPDQSGRGHLLEYERLWTSFNQIRTSEMGTETGSALAVTIFA